MKSIVGILFLLISVCGADILFEDNFDDGNADGWTEYSNYPDSAYYYVQDGWYHFEIEENAAYIASYNGDDSGTNPNTMSIPDYTIYCKTRAYSLTGHIGILGRFASPLSDETGYAVWLRYSSDTVVMWRHDGSGVWVELGEEFCTLEYNEEYWVRFDLWGGLLRTKVWQGSLSNEPAYYLISTYETTYTNPGSIGMGAQSWGYIQSHAAFDSVIVSDPLVSLDQTTWGLIKSGFSE